MSQPLVSNADILQIRPGCYFTCNSSGHIDHQRYWDLDYPDKYAVDHRSREALVLEVRERLLEAIRIRLRADVKLGVFLSGGIDSSVIAGMVTHLVKEKGVKYGTSQDLENIHCYSIGFLEDSGYDESGELGLLTKRLKLRLTVSRRNRPTNG
jgi:asparagine synthase (glutamine-hydrolysing)